MLEGADKIISIADDHGHTPTAGFDSALEPEVQRIVQVDVGQYGRDDAPLWGTRYRVNHLAVRFQDSSLEPFTNQTKKRLVINSFFEHPDHPIVINIVEKSFDVRFNHPIVPSIVERTG